MNAHKGRERFQTSSSRVSSGCKILMATEMRMSFFSLGVHEPYLGRKEIRGWRRGVLNFV